jgi:hypothetical protein
MARHVNTGACPKCLEIISKYPGFDSSLADWFKSFQLVNRDSHISCAGRGKVEQEADFDKDVSDAHWTESPHNYNGALDFFRLTQAGGAIFDRPWYLAVLAPAAKKAGFVWGGDWIHRKDYPHVEIVDFKKNGKLVE